MTGERAREAPESQKGPGAGFDPREITTFYVHFLPILAEFHKRGTDPLGSTDLGSLGEAILRSLGQGVTVR